MHNRCDRFRGTLSSESNSVLDFSLAILTGSPIDKIQNGISRRLGSTVQETGKTVHTALGLLPQSASLF